jgi:hypothetical protein
VTAQIGEKIRDFAEFSHSDAKMLTESLRGLPTNVRIHFSLAQAKKIKATIDWVKDQDRANKTPSIAGTRSHSSVPYERPPSAKLIARQPRGMLRPSPRRHPLGNSLVRRFGIKWKAGLENQLFMLYGVNGVPLVYVIHEIEESEEGKTYANFTQECIEKLNSLDKNSLRIPNRFTTLSNR